MASVEQAVAWAESIARDDSHGYSQGGREGQDFDCSSLVCRSLRAAGFDAPSPSFSTRSMGDWLGRNGWTWHTGTSGVRRGDILWKTGHTGWAKDGYRSVEARLDERGQITGGRPGDQTGGEVGFFNISSMNWAGYWRYNGATSSTPAKEPTGARTGTGFGGAYEVVADRLNVRDRPSTQGEVVAQYLKGETVTLQDWWLVADGYVWGRYVGGSGNTRYVAVGPYTGGVSDRDFMVKR